MSDSIPTKQFIVPIETKRLILESFRPGDGVEVNRAIAETFDQLHLWMPFAKEMPSVEESEEFMGKAYQNFLEGKDFGLRATLRETGELVLCSGLHPREAEVPSYEIGYWCRAKYQGQGYVSEAVRAITRAGFEQMGANRIQIRCDVLNKGSRRVAERCGYRLEGEMRCDARDNEGNLRNTYYFALTSADYAQQKQGSE